MAIKPSLLRNSTPDISLPSSVNLIPPTRFEIRLISNRKFPREPAKVVRSGRERDLFFLGSAPRQLWNLTLVSRSAWRKRDQGERRRTFSFPSRPSTRQRRRTTFFQVLLKKIPVMNAVKRELSACFDFVEHSVQNGGGEERGRERRGRRRKKKKKRLWLYVLTKSLPKISCLKFRGFRRPGTFSRNSTGRRESVGSEISGLFAQSVFKKINT